ncbi:MAG TPA: hypothetical protein VEC06_13245 [Paucimonas sp.]|nr:hypothetical protein [Paucimonas sp.]
MIGNPIESSNIPRLITSGNIYVEPYNPNLSTEGYGNPFLSMDERLSSSGYQKVQLTGGNSVDVRTADLVALRNYARDSSPPSLYMTGFRKAENGVDVIQIKLDDISEGMEQLGVLSPFEKERKQKWVAVPVFDAKTGVGLGVYQTQAEQFLAPPKESIQKLIQQTEKKGREYVQSEHTKNSKISTNKQSHEKYEPSERRNAKHPQGPLFPKDFLNDNGFFDLATLRDWDPKNSEYHFNTEDARFMAIGAKFIADYSDTSNNGLRHLFGPGDLHAANKKLASLGRDLQSQRQRYQQLQEKQKKIEEKAKRRQAAKEKAAEMKLKRRDNDDCCRCSGGGGGDGGDACRTCCAAFFAECLRGICRA